MRQFTFSQDVLDQIRHDRYHHPHPRVQQKMEVLWLKSKGLIHADIADVSPRSVQRYLDEFEQGGLDRIRRVPWQGQHGELDDHRASLEDHFLQHPPRSAREAQQLIEEITGVRRGLTQVRAFLKKTWAGLAQGRNNPRQGRPRGASGVPGRPTPSPAESGPARPADRAVRRCSAFRVRAVPGLPVVPGAAVPAGAFGPETLQRAGRPERRHPRGDPGGQRQLHQRRVGLRAAACYRGGRSRWCWTTPATSAARWCRLWRGPCGSNCCSCPAIRRT
jgi:transposase